MSPRCTSAPAAPSASTRSSIADAISVQVPEHRAVAGPVGDGLQVHLQRHGRQRARRRRESTGRPRSRRPDHADDARHGRPQRLGDAARAANLSSTSGAVMTKVDLSRPPGLTPGAPVELQWATVVGNRVNCTGTCWSFVSIPLGTGDGVGADGTLSSQITGPGRPRRLARRPGPAGRRGQGAGARTS